MFEELFVRPSTIKRYLEAPLLEERRRYLQHISDSGAKPPTLRSTAADQLRLIRLLDLQKGDRVSVARVEAAAEEWSCPGLFPYRRRAKDKTRTGFIGHCVGWLRYLQWLEEPEKVHHGHTFEIGAFAGWMRGDRGLSEATVRGYCEAADEFFHWLAASGTPLASVKVNDIDQAIAEKNARGTCSRTTIRIYAERLRAFFRFAEDRAWCTAGLAEGIIPAHNYPDEPVPAGLARDDVRRLLSTTQGDCAVDKRDRAILLLLVTYGLRSREVRILQLDDLDWEKETLQVRRPKPGRTHLYPLSQSVGQAILRYILEVRPPCSDRTLFLTLRAPVQPLSRGGLGTIVRRRLDRLGIAAKRRGPHTLRHATAQHLLDHGMSLKTIGDFLGHRDLKSTAIYAKLNVNALRNVADFDLGGLA